MAKSTDIGQPKAVYYRENFIENGKKKSKWTKIPGLYIANYGQEVQIRTGDSLYTPDQDIIWIKKTTGVLKSKITQYTETGGE